MWPDVKREFRRREVELFASGGWKYGRTGKWPALSKNYHAWKMRQPYEPKTIMRLKNNLYRSLTQPARFTLEETSRRLVLGTDVHYARYHMDGFEVHRGTSVYEERVEKIINPLTSKETETALRRQQGSLQNTRDWAANELRRISEMPKGAERTAALAWLKKTTAERIAKTMALGLEGQLTDTGRPKHKLRTSRVRIGKGPSHPTGHRVPPRPPVIAFNQGWKEQMGRIGREFVRRAERESGLS
jgi:hypothetical protein